MESMTDMLGPGGALARHIPGFTPRSQQQEMAQSVFAALRNYETLIAEAGTGTGKTFAYLVPAVSCGEKVIISTGTKNLQDQVFHRDLPLVQQALGMPVSKALLKGRANYLCLYRLENATAYGQADGRSRSEELATIRHWAKVTQSGDISELGAIAEESPVWSSATSNADNCLGSECPSFSDCFLIKARKEAQQADILVVNHHLFFADMAIRDEGYGELLPGANAFIFDEAHQLPEIAAKFFSFTISSRQLLDLANDTVAESLKQAADYQALDSCAGCLQKAVKDVRVAFGVEPCRAAWAQTSGNLQLKNGLQELSGALAAFRDQLEPLAQSSKGLESCWRRSVELRDRLELVTDNVPENYIHWFETHKRGFVFHLTPMNVADVFRNYVQAHKRAWVFTSATLTVNDRFDHFTSLLGLENAQTCQWTSPFDYARQALMYIPASMPEPSERQYTQAVVEAALPIIEASQGRTFLLFTSHRALSVAHQLVRDRLDYELLVQGSMPRSKLLNRFRHAGNAVLMGTSSFWEGVDVRGEALSCVIVDKLPFAPPDDPIVQARIEALREQGANPFRDYQLPSAVITLKQGFGRLIRDTTDSGVIMICDPRLLTKSYGKVFLNSLPDVPLTHDVDRVCRFLKQTNQLQSNPHFSPGGLAQL